jgi:hypothetical protein
VLKHCYLLHRPNCKGLYYYHSYTTVNHRNTHTHTTCLFNLKRIAKVHVRIVKEILIAISIGRYLQVKLI